MNEQQVKQRILDHKNNKRLHTIQDGIIRDGTVVQKSSIKSELNPLVYVWTVNATFEFGEIQDCLDRLKKVSCSWYDMDINSTIVTVFMPSIYDPKSVKDDLIKLSSGNLFTHQHVDFQKYINSPDNRLRNGRKNLCDFYIDIRKDVLFWFKNDKFEKDFINLFTG